LKKILAAILTLSLCLIALTACGSQDAFDLYRNMNNAMSDLSSVQANVDARVSMEIDSEQIDVRMLMEIEQVMHDETNIELAMVMTTDMGAFGSMTMNMYYRDGYLYQDMMDIMGMRIRSPLPMDEMLEDMAMGGAALLFERGDIRELSIREVDANRELSFILDGDALSDALSDVMGDMMESMGISGMNMTFGDVDYTVLIGADYLPIEEHLVFTVEISFMGETINASYDMRITYVAFNTLTEINFPADLDEYVDGVL